MPLKPLDGFRSLVTHHCVTGSMRHIYEFHDYAISEDLLLGLGAGIGFVYWHMKGTLPFYGGRTNVGRPGEEGLEKTAGKRTGVRIQYFQSGRPVKAEKALLDLLATGVPVMVQADMGYLPYFNFPEEYHFGGHVVVVAGYDPASHRVLIADRDEKLHPVSLEDLARARGSTVKPFAPHNRWYTFDFRNKRLPTPPEVRQAIREAARGMLKPPIANLGVKGIRKAAELTQKWPDIMDEEQLRLTCFNVFIFIDAQGGTGGGIFRYMYGRFLKEAATIVGDRRLARVGEEMRTIGDEWQMVAQTFKKAHRSRSPANLLPEAAALMEEIADREQSAWEKLQGIVGHAG
jgi:hypothetical protein